MTPLIAIERAMDSPQLLGAALGSDANGLPASWKTWRTVLRAAFGSGLDEAEMAIFRNVAGDREVPKKRVRELWAIVARRCGKSRIAALVATFLALFVKHKAAPGETPTVLVLAASTEQAKVVFSYIKGFLDASDLLRGEVVNITSSEITLANGVVISGHSNSFRTSRGRTLVACIFDEVAFWHSEGAPTDADTYSALLPSLANLKGQMIGISTPYRRTGLLHQKYRDHYGQDGDVLVVQGDAAAFNPTLDAGIIAAQRKSDPQGAKSEWDAQFRSDLSQFLDDELVEAAVDPSRPLELPPQAGVIYFAFTDAAGGGADAYTLAICHRDNAGRIIVDLVRGTRKKSYNPADVTREYALLLKDYGIHKVTGNSYAAHWVSDAWRANGVIYHKAELAKSAIFLESLPLFTRSMIALPDHAVLLRELRLLERQVHRSGADSISHPRNGHDDHAYAVCGAAWLANKVKITIRTSAMLQQYARMGLGGSRLGQSGRIAPPSLYQGSPTARYGVRYPGHFR